MVLRSARFANQPRLEKAAANSPPLRKGESGDAVARLQLALIDVGFTMPITTKSGTRPPDGIYGDETVKTVGKFQLQQKLSNDGIAGHDTLTRLDQLLAANDKPAEPLPIIMRGDFKVTTARNAR